MTEHPNPFATIARMKPWRSGPGPARVALVRQYDEGKHIAYLLPAIYPGRPARQEAPACPA